MNPSTFGVIDGKILELTVIKLKRDRGTLHPNKIEAVMEIEIPKSKKEDPRFFGLNSIHQPIPGLVDYDLCL